MKKLYFFIICIFAVTLISCGSGKNQKTNTDATGAEVQSADGENGISRSADGKYDLFYNLEVGKTYTQTIAANVDIAQNIMGQSMDMETTMDMTFSFVVTDIADGLIKTEASYKSVAMSMSTPMGSFSFSSEESDPSSPLAFMSDLFRSMAGSTFTMSMTKYGEVVEVAGLEEMIDKAIGSLDLPASAIAEAKASMKQEFNEEKFLDQMRNNVVFPDHPVAIGDSWNTSASMDQMDLENTYTLKEVTDTEVIIDVKSKIKNMKMDGASGSLSGEQAGTTTLHRSSGWVKHANMKQNISGTVTMQGMESKVKMTSDITMSE